MDNELNLIHPEREQLRRGGDLKLPDGVVAKVEMTTPSELYGNGWEGCCRELELRGLLPDLGPIIRVKLTRDVEVHRNGRRTIYAKGTRLPCIRASNQPDHIEKGLLWVHTAEMLDCGIGCLLDRDDYKE